jgi:hypothetical protein
MPPAPTWRRRWRSASASAPSWSSLSWTGSRNVAFLAAVMDQGVDFVACDNPHANKLACN